MDLRTWTTAGSLAVIFLWAGACSSDDLTFDDGGTAGSGNTGNTGNTGTGASNNGGSGGQATGGSSNSGGNANGGSAGGSVVDCEAINMELRQLLAAAQQCIPGPGEPQCTEVIEGLCCPEVVNPANDAAIDAYDEALKVALDAGCDMLCPEIPCVDKPTAKCTANPNGNGGQCKPGDG